MITSTQTVFLFPKRQIKSSGSLRKFFGVYLVVLFYLLKERKSLANNGLNYSHICVKISLSLFPCQQNVYAETRRETG